MKFSRDMTVYTRDGEHAGQIDRVVLDPQMKTVSDLVLREGFFFPNDVVVPINMVQQKDTESLVLTINDDDLEALPAYEDQHYLLLEPSEVSRGPALAGNMPALYRWYIPAGAGVPPGEALFTKDVETRQKKPSIPAGSIPLETGAVVVTADGATAGNVKRVYSEPESNQATHFVVEQGMIATEQKLIPIEWVDNVSEQQVTLIISEYSLSKLPKFDPNSSMLAE